MTIPRVATYRLQFRNGMTFDRAVEIVPYLKGLGISHLYASPVFTAASGSTHGYDVVDYNEFDPALGGREGFERLHAALRAAEMGLVLDIVPNHMAASLENPWWRSVVEFGSSSHYASHFDIDWSRRLTLPILGRDYRDVLASGELRLEADAKQGNLALAYFDNRLPLNPETYRLLADRLAEQGLGLQGLADLAESGAAENFHDGVRSWLAAGGAARLKDALALLSSDTGFINQLHERQSWQLMFWKDARRDLSYRRFFEVTGLVGVRVEDEVVFSDAHRLVLSLVREGKVDGLRVDHVDGLAAPTSYLARLREAVGPETWLLVEKILEGSERLPVEWREIGTTGYEFISASAHLLVDAEGLQTMQEQHDGFTGGATDVERELRSAKLLMLERNFEGELARLTDAAGEIAEAAGFEASSGEIRKAITELIIGFGVYRTYGEQGELTAQDRSVLEHAVASATKHGDGESIAFIVELLQGCTRYPAQQDKARAFRIRFQQLTGPIMAKALEDTLFYRLNPFIALNEVGSTPGISDYGVEHFHRTMQDAATRPASLVATATHDTKRGEDARARLYALAERPQEWSAAVGRWSNMNARYRRLLDGVPAPEKSVEWLIYQALAGMWPINDDPRSRPNVEHIAERLLPYLEKALREAKLRSDWLDADEQYEEAVCSFANDILQHDEFLSDFTATLSPIAEAGLLNSISQTLAKLTVPGVPDIYQGSEMLDLSLVDPDNRRPVDFESLDAALAEKGETPLAPTLDGRFKQWMIEQCLAVRAARPSLFEIGAYEPLEVRGAAARFHAAFLRQHQEDLALVVLQRLPLSRRDLAADSGTGWIELPAQVQGRTLYNPLTQADFIASPSLNISDALGGLPVALWVSRRA